MTNPESGCPFHPPKAKLYKGETGFNLLGKGAKRDLFSIFNEKSYQLKMSRQPMLFRDIFLINNPANFRQLLIEMPDRVPKSELLRQALEPLVGDGIFLSNGATWHRRRAMVEPAFRALTPATTFDHINGAVDDMITRLDKRTGGDYFDLEAELSHVTADAIFRAIFSEKLDSLVAQDLFLSMQNYQHSLPLLSLKSILGLPRWLPGGVSREGKKYAGRIREVLNQLIQNRLNSNIEKDDLLQKLIEARDEQGKGFTEKELVDEIAVLFLAGHETTASVLCWAIFLTRQDRSAHNLILHEIRTQLGDQPINYQALKKLETSKDLFAEALRLYPPVPFFTRELSQSTPMRDWIMKKGAMVVVSPWLIHRHRQFWKDPDSFIAKRFARGQKDKVDKRAYLPFGIGPRVCPGAAFALMEGPLILASLFQQFEFEIESDPELRPVCRLTTRPSHPIYMKITARKQSGKTPESG
jgi:cytochrome P450